MKMDMAIIIHAQISIHVHIMVKNKQKNHFLKNLTFHYFLSKLNYTNHSNHGNFFGKEYYNNSNILISFIFIRIFLQEN